MFRWHLIFNLGIQLVLGLPLEMVHGSGRVATIYMSGVLAGIEGEGGFMFYFKGTFFQNSKIFF